MNQCKLLNIFNWDELNGKTVKVIVDRGPGYEMVSLRDEKIKKSYVIKVGPNPNETQTEPPPSDRES